MNVVPLTEALRDRARPRAEAQDADEFMTALVTGRGCRDDYVALVAQHYFIYRAIEQATERMAADPVAARFISPRLTRLPAIEADLDYLVGHDWREVVRPLASTAAYVERIEQVGSVWVGGFIAHHYTRYLGDLSGGRLLRSLLQRQFGFDTNGVGLYLFAEIAEPRRFCSTYREALDQAPWDDDERARVVAEVENAYRLTTDVFAELARGRATAPLRLA
ncbi:heme oxygenase (biliverdin-producing) [Clavibacter michiganensis]|uniref:biliverdin-producing heme oxygenase n=1 Tax=Clavibacter michiganensis TaxID=28447 RepID=UPI000A39C362|nr:biliverdin-producing heme oxygenase [Clavibacter michiganensis]MDO4098798.1 biliverdin-producing heme oxygenase [Clavibacter michiganensis]MDO4127864.1 biliverdin-producing heme oxygenase [Clavibacter michiganensis]MWJ46936.1 biliverdin-producing heme oxygenase [Clavibacter michiganensis subsp. michiganensis]NIY59486.1 biliverdin-producing heme oxygenase [Clavibacter michiganensis subsp. michiganensis]OUE22083.1 Heme oxygenase 1 [Clavibacter michiganensis subsp. michiganensis]